MAKELRFQASVTVPDSPIEQAKKLAQIAEHKAAFEQAVSAVFGQPFVLTDKVVSPGLRGDNRAPRKAKAGSAPAEAAPAEAALAAAA